MSLTPADARHLLRRAAYGGLPAEVNALVGLSRADAVDKVMSTVGATTADDVPSVTRSSSERRRLAHWWIEQMTTTPAPIVERLTYFWHSHFACTSERVRDQRLMKNQHWLFRAYGQGGFHYLLTRVATDPAMLIDLDNASNVAGDEQENFGRELMELYTIGRAVYSEDEVVSMARAWTGHNLDDDTDPDTYRFYSDRHDKHDKTLFGITRKWDAMDTIDELVNGVRRDYTAWFLATKLWAEFGDPRWASVELIQALADIMKANGMRALDVIREIFLRDEFWAPERRFAMVKPPIPWVVELQRRTGQRLSEYRLDQRCDTMGQRLFLPPSVAGWGHNTAWLSGMSLMGRARVAYDLARDAQEAGFLAGLGDKTPDAAVDQILTAFGVPDASPESREVLRTWYLDAALVDDLSDTWLEREGFRVGAMLPEVNLS